MSQSRSLVEVGVETASVPRRLFQCLTQQGKGGGGGGSEWSVPSPVQRWTNRMSWRVGFSPVYLRVREGRAWPILMWERHQAAKQTPYPLATPPTPWPLILVLKCGWGPILSWDKPMPQGFGTYSGWIGHLLGGTACAVIFLE